MFRQRIGPDAELRMLQPEDAPALFTLCDSNREHLARFLPWVDATRTISDSAEFIRKATAQNAENLGFHAGIWYQEQLAGCIGMHPIDQPNRAVTLGYWIAQSFEGKGLVTAACRAMVEESFETYRLHRVEIRCAVRNPRSCAIPLRLGFQEEGVLRAAQRVRDDYLDCRVFSRLGTDR